jgi:hypothetical protein
MADRAMWGGVWRNLCLHLYAFAVTCLRRLFFLLLVVIESISPSVVHRSQSIEQVESSHL